MKPPLIVGAGPAGSTAAIMLAQAGIRPVLIERQRETGDALCGGFLSWRTLESLHALGIEPAEGQVVRRLRLFAQGEKAELRLPEPALGLSRHRLDSLLIAAAEAKGAGVERGVHIKEWAERRLITGDGAVMTPETLFLATGKHDLRGIGRPRETDGDQTVGLRVRLRPHPALDRLVGDAIELHLFDGGYCGVVLHEGGMGNLCLAVRKSRLAEAGNPDALLAQWADESAFFGERLAFRESGSDAIGAVPYGWIAQSTEPDLFRLGDQAAVIPSLAGEGNGIAIASGVMAAEAWLAGQTAAAFQARFSRAAGRPVSIARWIWHRAEHPGTARLGLRAARLAPWLVAQLAGWTRIPH